VDANLSLVKLRFTNQELCRSLSMILQLHNDARSGAGSI